MADGYYATPRHWHSADDLFWREKRELSRWEARCDLYFLAAYRDHDVMYDGKVVHLRRGQIPTSERKLMDRWNWRSRGKVRRFLKALSDLGEVSVSTDRKPDHATDHVTDHGLTLVTLMNYEDSQGEVLETDHGTDHATDHKRTKQKKGKKGVQKYTSDFDALWRTHRRGPKAKAFDEYEKAVSNGITHSELLTELSAYVKVELRPDFRGVHLHRWIREHRWEERPSERLPQTERRLRA